jgi:hypothetical protein
LIDSERILEITQNVNAGKSLWQYFLTARYIKKFSEELVWKTEVWIADVRERIRLIGAYALWELVQLTKYGLRREYI